MRSDKTAPELPILFLDHSVCVVDKPRDVFVHPNPLDRDAHDCLHLLRGSLGGSIYNVHRIDRPTSGIVLFCLTKPAASHVSAQFREGSIGKYYLALVRGHFEKETVVDLPIPRSRPPRTP